MADQTSPPDQAVMDTTPYGNGPDASVTDTTETAAVTHHVVTIGGKTIPYTARAGHLVTIEPATAQPNAKFFYVSFTADGLPASGRPVTFFYNGGPGSSAVFLLLGSFAPRRIKTSLPDFTPPAPYTLEDNPDSLLDRTDLVFINPIGTGYSAAVAPHKNREFWGVDEDARSIKDFIKRYLTVYDRWNSPKFLFGESYGTARSCVLAWLLHEDGVDLNGITLQSSILDYAQTGNPIGLLPTLAADAFYHGKVKLSPPPKDLPGFMQTVTTLAAGPYGPAVTAFPTIDQHILTTLTDILGISPIILISWGLDVAASNTTGLLFLSGLLQSEGLALGAYDGRATAIDTGIAGAIDPAAGGNDPTMTAVSGVYTAMWNAYLNDELRYTSISPFTDLNDQTFRFWNFAHIDPTGAQKGKDVNGNVVLYTAGDLAATMALNPDLKVFSANGYYDSVTPFFQTAITLAAMPLVSDKVRANITVRNYPSGHMVYLDGPSRTAMKADLSTFYGEATTRFVVQQHLARQLQFCHPYVKFAVTEPGIIEPRAAAQYRWSVPDLCRAYQWPTGLAGGGVIAIIELGGGWITSDMTAYFAAIGQPMPTIIDVSVAGNGNAPNTSASDPGPDAEVTLDIQIAASAYFVATGHPAMIRVYWCGNDPSAIAAGIRAAAADGCDTCSISWGAAETVWQQASQQLGQDLPALLDAAAAAATQAGMVIFAAAGDNDSSDGSPNPATVDLPSSSPHVVGCGGTRKTPTAETVWNDSPGNPNGNGTGGGFSAIFKPQPWEAGAPHGPGRMVPDVAADADPATGFEVIVHGQSTVIGGTSAVAPLYAGLFASFGRKLGFVNAILWSNHLAFNDITQGDNGHYRARIGPDPCTGLGSPIGSKLATLLAAAATPIDPGSPTTVASLVPPHWSGVVSLTFVDGHVTKEELAPTAPAITAKRRGRRASV